jgi:hypothetical protein
VDTGLSRRLLARGPAILVIVLLAITAAAFVRTEQQKLERSPVIVEDVDPVFSPVCGCATSSAEIVLRLRRKSRVSLEIVDREDQVVRRLIEDRSVRGRFVASWDGRTDEGGLAPDGIYRPRLRLASADRAFLLTNRIRVDTRGPRATIVEVAPRIVTPNGDGRNDRVSIKYRLSERGQPLLLVDGAVRVRGQKRREGKLEWYGNRARGKRARAGRHRLQIAGVDEAGNLGDPSPAIVVRLRVR